MGIYKHTYAYSDNRVGDRNGRFAADSLGELLSRLRDNVTRWTREEMAPEEPTRWVHCRVEREDHLDLEDHREKCAQRDEDGSPTCYYGKIQVDPPEPRCRGGKPHSWTEEDTPGNLVMTLTGACSGMLRAQQCSSCGTTRETSTNATDPVDGSDSNRSVRYVRRNSGPGAAPGGPAGTVEGGPA